MLQRHRSRYSRVPSAPSTSTSTVAPPYTRLTRRKLLFILCTFLAFASLTIPLLLPSFGSSMRLCLPLNLTRVSEQLHRAVACASPSVPAAILAASTSASIASTRLQTLARPLTTTTSPATSTVARQSFSISASSSIIPSAAATNTSNMATSVTPGRLADWLLSQKEAFLGDLAAGRGKGWLVAMGNEAGDLDTIASSIAYAYLATSLQAERVVPVLLTPRKYMHLRPENFLALAQANIPDDVLLHLEDLPVPAAQLLSTGVDFVLVDHNRLLPAFGTDDAAYARVKAIVDHHEDEGVSLAASPRIIQVPNGSSTSLVSRLFHPQWSAALSGPAGLAGSPVPPEVATLLLSALVIDTHGLKAGGKATQIDIEAAEFLYPISSLPPPGTDLAVASAAGFTAGTVPPALLSFSDKLTAAKYDVSDMGEHDLLLRDYKQYPWDTSSLAYPRLVVGLCTVPVKLETVLDHEGGWANFLSISDGYMSERGLDVVGIATTWKNSEGKSRRELLLAVRAGGGLPDLAAANAVMSALATGLGADTETFRLEEWKYKNDKNAPQPEVFDSPARVARVWRQGNAHSTRKQLAPAMHHIVEALK